MALEVVQTRYAGDRIYIDADDHKTVVSFDLDTTPFSSMFKMEIPSPSLEWTNQEVVDELRQRLAFTVTQYYAQLERRKEKGR